MPAATVRKPESARKVARISKRSATTVIVLSLTAGAAAAEDLDDRGRTDLRSGRSSDHKYVNGLTLWNRCVQYWPTHSEAVGGTTDLSVEISELYLAARRIELCRH
jgi:hypothetical protein